MHKTCGFWNQMDLGSNPGSAPICWPVKRNMSRCENWQGRECWGLTSKEFPGHFAVPTATFHFLCLLKRGVGLGPSPPLWCAVNNISSGLVRSSWILKPFFKALPGREGICSRVSVVPCPVHLGPRWGEMTGSGPPAVAYRPRAF